MSTLVRAYSLITLTYIHVGQYVQRADVHTCSRRAYMYLSSTWYSSVVRTSVRPSERTYILEYHGVMCCCCCCFCDFRRHAAALLDSGTLSRRPFIEHSQQICTFMDHRSNTQRQPQMLSRLMKLHSRWKAVARYTHIHTYTCTHTRTRTRTSTHTHTHTRARAQTHRQNSSLPPL